MRHFALRRCEKHCKVIQQNCQRKATSRKPAGDGLRYRPLSYSPSAKSRLFALVKSGPTNKD